MKQIKENAIANQKKIIAELRENTSCESSREIAIAKLNLIVDDYEKDNNVIDAVNIYLYYEFMSQDILNIYGELLHPILTTRRVDVDDILNVSLEQLSFSYDRKGNWTSYTYFGLKDILKPIDEYIKEIKDSNDYKQYRFNYLVETYDLSTSHLEKLEHTLFADDSSYVSNIDNLIYAALDNVADDFKMNVINYIEENYLQEETGINCISDIPVIIKDGEFQGLFKEFESYGLNDFSVQNITMFIDRYRELKALDENKTCIEKAL
jgi:hypothetical protein